jgi:hypothetical protein
MKKPVVRIHVQRSVGHTSVSLECPPEERDKAVESAKELLSSLPESSFTGDGVAITSIPMHGPDMDGPQGFFRRINPDE